MVDDLRVPVSKGAEARPDRYEIPVAVPDALGARSVMKIAVGLHDDPSLHHQIDPTEACYGNLTSNIEADIPELESEHRLQARLGGSVDQIEVPPYRRIGDTTQFLHFDKIQMDGAVQGGDHFAPRKAFGGLPQCIDDGHVRAPGRHEERDPVTDHPVRHRSKARRGGEQMHVHLVATEHPHAEPFELRDAGEPAADPDGGMSRSVKPGPREHSVADAHDLSDRDR